MAEQIIKTEYSEVMQKSYIDYAMSVICQRALPDIRDGLKPVQRRVLYAMNELKLNYDKPHRKSARIVGDTMGKYHPHGDSSIYEALVVLEQDFKKGMALVDGHGNFGSIEGDGAAAMRYTEAKLKKFTQDVYLADLDKNVVDFIPNFDETEKEPEVLPVRVPNVLVNGAEGIAVGMTTSIPTHNLGEVVDALIAYMGNQKITTEELLQIMPGPDFPTGGIVINKDELLNIYETGNGKIKVRGKVEFEPAKNRSDKDKLVISEIPYTMIGQGIGKFLSDVCDLIENKKTQDIVDISNQSSKEGIRIVIELKKNADVEKLKNLLYTKTKLQDTFSVNMLTIADGRPEIFGVKKILEHHLNFQVQLATRKYTTLLERAMEQKEIKEGLIRACNIIDLIIEILRGSKSIKDAKECLVNGNTDNITFKHKESKIYAGNLNFTEKQAQAILELRLYRLIGLEILALEKEYEDLVNLIAQYEEILNNPKAMMKVIKKDLEHIKKEYAVPRRTLIENGTEAVYVEEKVKEQEVVLLMDRFGYAKTMDVSIYERNKEAADAENRYVLRCMNTDKLCIFTDNGNLHQVKILDIPFLKMKDKGTPIDNLGNYDSKGESIVFLASMQMLQGRKLLFTTALGMMKLVDSEEFNVTKRTVAATKLGADDLVISVEITEAVSKPESLASGTLTEGDNGKNGQSEADANTAMSGGVITGGAMTGGMEDAMMGGFEMSGGMDDGFAPDFDDEMGFAEMSFDFGPDMELAVDIPAEDGAQGSPDENVACNQIVVLQTEKGMFLRFPLREIPEKKKGAIGVRGIKLAEGDRVTNVYLMDAGDNITVDFKGKEIALRKLKTTKHGAKGTKKG